jgi:hypothetical protein
MENLKSMKKSQVSAVVNVMVGDEHVSVWL